MKTKSLLALLCVACLHASAQSFKPPVNEPDYKKPKVFADLPNRQNLRLTDAETLLDLAEGTNVNAALANGFVLKGTVVSKSNPADPSVRSVVIKSTNRQGITFTFSRVKKADGSFAYRGRLMGRTAGDALEIVKDGSTYVMQKKDYNELINE